MSYAPAPLMGIKTLCRWMGTGRPYGSVQELDFGNDLADICRSHYPYFFDREGNLHVDARADGSERVLFSAHLDTAASKAHTAIKPRFDITTQCLYPGKGAPILGADNSAGVWILMNMLLSKVGGYYVFHVGEERGGIGSAWLRDNWGAVMQASTFDYAIAFDRKNTSSIITHQGWSRCCSDEFGDALADQLMSASETLLYYKDDTGVFTDTANYTHLIPECTNVSVGYFNEHTSSERLHLPHLKALMEACLLVQWSALPVKRNLNDVDDYDVLYDKHSGLDFGPVMEDGFCVVCGQDWTLTDTWVKMDVVPEGNWSVHYAHTLDRCPDPFCESSDEPSMHTCEMEDENAAP